MAITCWSIPMRLMLVTLLISLAVVEAKDLYKILGVEKNASQREIQKAFHRLSLKYHPDKNPAKSAQAKFAEINNAYEVLSDEEKRKNYDLFGDEQGRAREAQDTHGDYSGFHNSNTHGSSQGWTHFSYDSSDGKRYRFEQHGNDFGSGEASFTQGGFYNFPFGSSFGRREQSSTFGFGGDSSYFGNLFENLFSSAKDRQYSSYSTGSGKSRGKSSFQGTQTNQFSIGSEQLTPKSFQKRVLDQHYTWAVIFSPSVSKNLQEKLQVLEDISSNLHGSIKVGYVNCDTYKTLCKEQHIWPVKAFKLVLYSLRSNGKLSPLEYTGEWSVKDVKNYCVEALPRFTKHVHIEELEDHLNMEPNIPHVVLFTRRKEAAAVWRALSGLFHKRVVFYDVQVDEDNFPHISSKFAVNSLPAVVGIYENGEIHALSSGNRLELISSSLEEFKGLIQKFEEKSKAAGPRKEKAKADNEIPSLTKNNFKIICSQDTTLCIIGVYKSASGKESVKKILKEISQKSLTRKGQRLDSRNPVSYAVLDANKQSAFLVSFDQKTFRGRDVVLLAYKPKKKTYVLYDDPRTLEDIENFVVEVISGDVQLKPVLQDPIFA